MSAGTPPVDENAPEKKRGSPIALLAAIAAGVGGAGGGYLLTPILLGQKANDEEKIEHATVDIGASNYEGKAAENQHGEERASSDGHEKKPPASAKNKTDPKSAHGSAGEPECADACDSEFTVVGETAFYAPQAMIISIRPGARVRHLKIAFAVETAPDANAAFNNNAIRLKDTLTAYLRTIEPSALEDPSAFETIRAQLARRVSAVVAPAPVRAILITEFILT